jgi:hypothetical protein
VLAEIGPDLRIGVIAEKLTDDHPRDRLTIAEQRGESALTQALRPQPGLELIVYTAIHHNDKVFQRHGRFLNASEVSGPSSQRSSDGPVAPDIHQAPTQAVKKSHIGLNQELSVQKA